MKKQKIATNLHRSNSVTKWGKRLNQEEKIHHWSADGDAPDKAVTIHDNSTPEAAGLIQKAGAKATAQPTTSHHLHHATGEPASRFWFDKLVWRRASLNTFTCLIGCSIGDFGVILYLQLYHPHTPMPLQMILAIVAGLITSIAFEATLLRLKEKMLWKKAFQMALSMSVISIIGMEIAMNATDFMITGAKAQISSLSYWMAFIPAALAGFLAPLPYNYYQLKKYNRSHH